MRDGQADWMFSTSIMVQASNGMNPVLTSFTLRKEGATVDTQTEVHTAGTMHGSEPTLAGWSSLLQDLAGEEYQVHRDLCCDDGRRAGEQDVEFHDWHIELLAHGSLSEATLRQAGFTDSMSFDCWCGRQKHVT
jgi:hypothetical protein